MDSRIRKSARTAGSNLIIGGLFTALVLLIGSSLLVILTLIPMAILGVLLFFAGVQLALTIADVKEKKELFVILIIFC
jgi:sulfate permease, SulP family